jgi:hypothetical protein
MQMFRFVKNIATAIDWLTKPKHVAFGKHELRQIKYLMGDLGHLHIFTSMLASAVFFFNFNLCVILI